MPTQEPKKIFDASHVEAATIANNDRFLFGVAASQVLTFLTPSTLVSYLQNALGLANKADLVNGQIPASQARASTISYNSATGIISFTDAKGTQTDIDLPIENLFQNAGYNSGSKTLTLTTNGGGTINVPLADLVDLPEIVVATTDPGATPTSGQKLFLRSDTGEYWISNGTAWQGKFLAFTAAERTKLSGIASGATANSTDVQLRDRSTHTGSQPAASISDFTAAARASFSPGANISIVNGVISATGSSGTRPKEEILTSKTLTASDLGKHLYYQGSTPITITVPGGLTASEEVEITARGTGTVTVTSVTGVNLNGGANSVVLGQHSACVLIFYTSANVGVFGGLQSTDFSYVPVTSSRSLTIADKKQFLGCDSASAMSITVPADTVPFNVGDFVELAWIGTGAVTVNAATDVVVRRYGSVNTTGHLMAGRNAVTVLKKIAANTWLMVGGI